MKISTAEQLLASDAEVSMKQDAAQATLLALATLQQYRVGDAEKRMEQFCNRLKKDPDPKLELLGRQMGFAHTINAFVQGDLKETAPVLDDFKQLVDLEVKDDRLLQFCKQVASLFEQRGFEQASLDVLVLTKESFGQVEDEELAAQVADLAEEAKLIRSEVRPRFNEMMSGAPGAVEQFLAAAKVLLSDGQPSRSIAQTLLEQPAPELERMNPTAAGELYDAVSQAFNGHPDTEAVAYVEQTAEYFSPPPELARANI